MGASNSKIEDDKALALCRERKHFVKQALDGRCLLAASHVSYVDSLRNTGVCLRQFVVHVVLGESSMQASTSAMPNPQTVSPKTNLQLSNSNPSVSQHFEASEPFSSSPSTPLSGNFHVNHMTSARVPSIAIEERSPVLLTATLQTSSPLMFLESDSKKDPFHLNHMKNVSFPPKTIEERPPVPETVIVEASSPTKHSEQLSKENLSSEVPPLSDSPPQWDYFVPFHPLDSQFSIEERKVISHRFDNADDIWRLTEEEGIPELEEENEHKTHAKNRDSFDSADDFDGTSNEPLVQIYRNRNTQLDENLTHASPGLANGDNVVSETDHMNGEFALPLNRKKEPGSERKPNEDIIFCFKEIEVLFIKASNSGREIPRMLEANKLQNRPFFTEERASKSKASIFLASCFTCCEEEVQLAQVPTSNEMKYLTWHSSMSSRFSPSRIPLGAAPNDDAEDLTSNLLSSTCMNAGSHASTLDRLYAWERKLYDEVKASGAIRREYDLKCRLLRLQDSRAESPYKIDKTRAVVKDLHSRIRVAIHRIDSISKSIEELRDKELQPQLEELIGVLTRMWAMMLDCHKNQSKIISDVCIRSSTKVSASPELHQQVVELLQLELRSLSSSFTKWISAHKFYLQAINNWLLKCVLMAPAAKNKSTRRKSLQFSPRKDIAPAIFVTCQDWLKLLEELPEKEVEDAINKLIEVAAQFLPRTERGDGGLRSTLSFSRKVNEEIQREEETVDWSLNYDSLQSCLAVFFDRLKSFAESSLAKYEALQRSINEARDRYDTTEIRK
ncbi:hypothetical protein HPP92_006391 [Vanilla planifolia]|uniref:Uncharacterized protein n=1 Tax=Vanilla planifolia TaxID=51239 RepID=A0A835RNS2_VANPL|nr:hypothetical protein HPP92_006391 [Vanilla planifolia]